jgi:hypothetical protein
MKGLSKDDATRRVKEWFKNSEWKAGGIRK